MYHTSNVQFVQLTYNQLVKQQTFISIAFVQSDASQLKFIIVPQNHDIIFCIGGMVICQ
jgi:hypothetical protein